jgi:hypothetical protein
VIRGVTPATVNVIDEDHSHADTYPDEQVLRSGFTGAARILWKEPGIGELLALIEMGPADRDRFAARLTETEQMATLRRDWPIGSCWPSALPSPGLARWAPVIESPPAPSTPDGVSSLSPL